MRLSNRNLNDNSLFEIGAHDNITQGDRGVGLAMVLLLSLFEHTRGGGKMATTQLPHEHRKREITKLNILRLTRIFFFCGGGGIEVDVDAATGR